VIDLSLGKAFHTESYVGLVFFSIVDILWYFREEFVVLCQIYEEF